MRRLLDVVGISCAERYEGVLLGSWWCEEYRITFNSDGTFVFCRDEGDGCSCFTTSGNFYLDEDKNIVAMLVVREIDSTGEVCDNSPEQQWVDYYYVEFDGEIKLRMCFICYDDTGAGVDFDMAKAFMLRYVNLSGIYSMLTYYKEED